MSGDENGWRRTNTLITTSTQHTYTIYLYLHIFCFMCWKYIFLTWHLLQEKVCWWCHAQESVKTSATCLVQRGSLHWPLHNNSFKVECIKEHHSWDNWNLTLRQDKAFKTRFPSMHVRFPFSHVHFWCIFLGSFAFGRRHAGKKAHKKKYPHTFHVTQLKSMLPKTHSTARKVPAFLKNALMHVNRAPRINCLWIWKMHRCEPSLTLTSCPQ